MTDAQRRKIADGRLKGKTSRQVAAETGLSPKTVRTQGVDIRTQTLIQELKKQHAPQLRRAFGKALEKTESLIGNEDPIVALRASRTVVQMVEAGDPPLARLGLDRDSGERECTLEELLVIYRRVTG